ncbi:MAG: NAD(P)-binding protein, partial [candidate division WS1 bacterium]|nr:NAD(P)-binding protein [candidate division WS1 bacterium]
MRERIGMPPAEAHIIGAGPAGLSCALELSRRGRGSLVFEKEAQVGGIARTEQVAGCRFDLGPHRFFTKEPEIRALWQGLLGKDLLTVQRLTRIYYRNRFFDYPLKLLPTLRKLGPVTSLAILGSYLWARVRPCRDPRSFEEWVVNQFGRRLFETFFRSYTEKVWGMPCDQISADWAAQRIKQLSLLEMVKGALGGDRARHASLIEEFHYPRHGAGMMWEAMAREIQHRGGDLRLGTTV